MASSKNLAKHLALYQAESQKKDKEISSELGISTSTFYKLKKGEEGFNSATLDRIAEVTGKSPSMLLADPDQEDIMDLISRTMECYAALDPDECEQALYHYCQAVIWASIGEQRRRDTEPRP